MGKVAYFTRIRNPHARTATVSNTVQYSLASSSPASWIDDERRTHARLLQRTSPNSSSLRPRRPILPISFGEFISLGNFPNNGNYLRIHSHAAQGFITHHIVFQHDPTVIGIDNEQQQRG